MSIVRARTRPKASRQRRIADSYDARAANDRSSWRPYSSYSFMRDVHGTSPGSSSRPRLNKPHNPTPREVAQDRRVHLQQIATSKYANM